jgi:hypothetical protein
MAPIPPDTPLTVTLEAQQWNAVIAALSEAPFRIAAPLIQAITGQLQGQAAQVQQQPRPGANGVDDTPAA